MSTQTIIRWTRQADGTYIKEVKVPADTPNVRIFAMDEDYDTNPYAICPGLKLWPKEEAGELVERKIADGWYQAWRYEIRSELSNALTPPAPAQGSSERPESLLCANDRCKKGPNGTRGPVKNPRAKYCSPYCRIDACRRSRPKPQDVEKPARKRRRDTKYSSHSERQRAYYARHRSEPLLQAIRDYLETRARVAAKRASEPL